MPLGGGVIKGECEPLGDGYPLNCQRENRQSQILDLESEGGEEVIIGAIAASDPRGAEPTGDSPSPLSQDDAND
jgi:hypothetical protein